MYVCNVCYWLDRQTNGSQPLITHSCVSHLAREATWHKAQMVVAVAMVMARSLALHRLSSLRCRGSLPACSPVDIHLVIQPQFGSLQERIIAEPLRFCARTLEERSAPHITDDLG